MERNERQGAEYARLDQAHQKGLLGLSEEDAAKYKAYNDAHEAGRAKLEAAAAEERAARQQAVVDGIKADEAAYYAKAQAESAAQRAAEAARKKPEPQPGTLPAVASAKAPEGVDSSAAIGALLQKEKVKEALTTMFTPEQLAPLAEQSKQEYRDKYNDPRKMTAATMESEIQRLEGLAKERGLTFIEQRGLEAARDVLWDKTWTDNSINEAKGSAIGLGVVTFGAALWTGPVATAVETGVAYALDKTAEHMALAAGASPETASNIGTVTGFVTPFATMGKAGALAEATITPALKAAGTVVKGAAVEALESSIAGIKAAGRDLAQWRPDYRNATGCGGLPFTKKAPAPAGHR